MTDTPGPGPGPGPRRPRGPRREATPPATDGPEPRPAAAGWLSSARQPPPTVTLDEPLANAVQLMTDNSIGRLAVVDGAGNLRGSLGWPEVAAVDRPADALVRDAAVPGAPVIRAGDPLADCLQAVTGHGFAFVAGPDGTLSGMVTSLDLTRLLGEETALLGATQEAEHRLRAALLAALQRTQAEGRGQAGDPDAIARLRSGRAGLGECAALLRRPDVWPALGWKLPQDSTVARVDRLRQARDGCMRFPGSSEEDRAAQAGETGRTLAVLRAVVPWAVPGGAAGAEPEPGPAPPGTPRHDQREEDARGL
jgi:CBS domain-containing protein